MSEGSLEAPTRHPIDWNNPDFFDEEKLDKELRRVFDICHSCRRCFNLCDSFPRLFDLIDEADTGELDSVDSKNFEPVVNACTLCDMCFMTKCPYVPPHEFNLDFPHLMLRYRAIQNEKNKSGFWETQLTETDRNGKLASPIAPITNWLSKDSNPLTRPLAQALAGIHKEAALPKFNGKTLLARATAAPISASTTAPTKNRKAVLYATCFGNYNSPEIGDAARAVLAHNGVEVQVAYSGCCGMPQLEKGNIARVAESAKRVSEDLGKWIDDGYDVIALVPSCALMMKFEWPLILPDDQGVKILAQSVSDLSEYVVAIANDSGLADGLRPLTGGISLHHACHARAQNMGAKAAEMLRQLPDSDVVVIERCSGHGGAWGVMGDNFETALKVGKPVARQVIKNDKAFIASECPLAVEHIAQGVDRLSEEPAQMKTVAHPILLMAYAYGLMDDNFQLLAKD